MGVFEMRELEFRAWDKVRNRMLTSAKFVEFKVINGVLSAVNYDWSGKEQVLEVVQYTGLKDANGVKIFEGNILGGGQSEPREVIFEDGSFRLYDDTSSGNQSIVPRSANRLKVIGNIYETPELLK
tara:strand:+ start:235 stop:612 length:378 start_codon:yes stop_codon:yes gene_type:complete